MSDTHEGINRRLTGRVQRALMLGATALLLGVPPNAWADRRDRPYVGPRAGPLADWHVEPGLALWYHTPSGTIEGRYQGVSGDLDLQDTLGLQTGASLAVNARLTHAVAWLPEVTLGWQPLSTDGRLELPAPLDFGGLRFETGRTIDSGLRLSMYDGTLAWRPWVPGEPARPWGWLEVGLTLRHLDGEATVSEVGSNRKAVEPLELAVLPLVYLGVEITPYRLVGGRIELRAIGAADALWIESHATVRCWPVGSGAWFGLGGRGLWITFDPPAGEASASVDAQLLGVYAEVGLRL